MKVSPLLVLAIVVALSGCVNFKPKPDRTQIFALAANLEPVRDVAGKPTCYVARVELPGFLEGTHILYRSAQGELDAAAGARWSEAPAESLSRAIAMHLQATGKAHVRAYYPWANRADDAATVSVQFERFSANPQGEVEVIAQWQIETPAGEQKEGRYVASDLVWEGSAVADYVAQLDAALSQLSAMIAQEL